MKKIKKLVLNRRSISNLSPSEMNHLKGGESFYGGVTCITACNDTCFGCPGGSSTDILGDCATIDYEVSTCEYCH